MLERLLLTGMIAAVLWLTFMAYRWYHARRIGQELTQTDGDGRPRILFFHSTHCAACAQQERYLNQLDPEYWPLVDAVHVEHRPELAAQYNVMTIPMTVFVGPDQAVHHINYGLANTQQLSTQLQALITN